MKVNDDVEVCLVPEKLYGGGAEMESTADVYQKDMKRTMTYRRYYVSGLGDCKGL